MVSAPVVWMSITSQVFSDWGYQPLNLVRPRPQKTNVQMHDYLRRPLDGLVEGRPILGGLFPGGLILGGLPPGGLFPGGLTLGGLFPGGLFPGGLL